MATFTQYYPTSFLFDKRTTTGESDVMQRSPIKMVDIRAKIDGPSSSKSAVVLIYSGGPTPATLLDTITLNDATPFEQFTISNADEYIMAEVFSISGTRTNVTVTADEWKNDTRIN